MHPITEAHRIVKEKKEVIYSHIYNSQCFSSIVKLFIYFFSAKFQRMKFIHKKEHYTTRRNINGIFLQLFYIFRKEFYLYKNVFFFNNVTLYFTADEKRFCVIPKKDFLHGSIHLYFAW